MVGRLQPPRALGVEGADESRRRRRGVPRGVNGFASAPAWPETGVAAAALLRDSPVEVGSLVCARGCVALVGGGEGGGMCGGESAPKLGARVDADAVV